MLTGKTRIGEVLRAGGRESLGGPVEPRPGGGRVELVGVIGREVILRDKLRDDPPPVDYLLIDCPPSLGILTLNALAAVSEVFIPLQPHFLRPARAEQAAGDDRPGGRAAQRSSCKLSGVILCMYDASTRLAVEVGQDVDEFFRNARGQADALGRRPDLPDADSPQRPPGRGPEFRQVDLPIRPRLARRRRLPASGGGSGGAGEGVRGVFAQSACVPRGSELGMCPECVPGIRPRGVAS